MKKLENRADIELLVNSFYQKLQKDIGIGFFFTEIVPVDWAHHLPKMYDFWESILFGQMTYKGNPMAAHFPINEKYAMQAQHFERWLALWEETVAEHFFGFHADAAITKAQNIARLMAFKMENARRGR